MAQKYDIGTLLHIISSSLDGHSDYVLQHKLGISLSQFRVLLSLLNEDGQNQISIADNLSQSEPSISRQVKLLQQKHFVTINSSELSKRDKLVFLTNKGLMVSQSAVSILNSYYSPMFDNIGNNQQAELFGLLTHFKLQLDKL